MHGDNDDNDDSEGGAEEGKGRDGGSDKIFRVPISLL